MKYLIQCWKHSLSMIISNYHPGNYYHHNYSLPNLNMYTSLWCNHWSSLPPLCTMILTYYANRIYLWSPQEETKLSGHSEWTQSWPKRSVWYYSPIPPCFLVWWSQLQDRFGRWGKFKESVIFLLLVKKSVTSPPPKDNDVSLVVNS